jgi:RNA polymerase sigma factor (sigma-70 family)
MSMTDRCLVVRSRAGDTAAFAVLLERHRARLMRVCASMLDDPSSVADVVQDATLVAWLQIDRLRDAERFGGWLAGIGRVLCLRALRERQESHLELTRDGALPARFADERHAPQERLLAAERAAELAQAIAALPAGQRDAIVLFHLADMPQATVAARLGTAAGAVRTRLLKGRATLRAWLTPTHDTMQEDTVPSPTAIPARILDVRRTPAGRHVVMLAAADTELPIWIGTPEAEALVVGLQDVELPRPNAHALALSLLEASGRRVSSVRVCRLEAAIFYAEVILDDGTAVDARPSDALVLAVATGCPIEIDRAVLDATVTGAPDQYVDDLARAAEGGAVLLAAELQAELAARADELAELHQAD